MKPASETSDQGPPIAHRLLAVALLLGVVAMVLVSLFGPLADALAARSQAAERLGRFEAALAQPAPQTRQYDPAELAAIRQDDGEAQIALQSILDRLFREAGVSSQSVRPLRPEDVGPAGRSVWVEANLSGDLQALVDLLTAMDAVRPTLLVRRLDVERTDASAMGRQVRIRIEAGQVWRTTGDAS